MDKSIQVGCICGLLVILNLTIAVQADIVFEEPKDVLSAKEGKDPGSFGWYFFQDEPDSPTDFTVDAKGNFWILDNVNHRIQKFDPQGNFVMTWSNDDRIENRGLEIDQEGNVYLLLTNSQHKPEIVVLNTNGMFSRRFAFQYWLNGTLQVTAEGDIYMTGGPTALLIHPDGQVMGAFPAIHYIYTCPFGQSTLMSMPVKRGYALWALRRFNGEPKEVPKEPNLLLKKSGRRYGEIVVMDREGNIFVMSSRGESPAEMKERIEIYDSIGNYMGEVPACPQREWGTTTDVPDYFETDIHGSLYQLQVIPPWERTSGGEFVKIWKWQRK